MIRLPVQRVLGFGAFLVVGSPTGPDDGASPFLPSPLRVALAACRWPARRVLSGSRWPGVRQSVAMKLMTFLGDKEIGRIGFGAMQLAGPGVFGPPRDPDAARAVLRRAIELGVDHIDTSQYYGPDVVNDLIRETLHPYPANLKLVTKVGARRDETGGWLPALSPSELREGVEANLRSLRVERMDLVNLRLLDEGGGPGVPPAEQLGELGNLRREGKLDLIGVSNVTLDGARQALELADVAGVQNAYSLLDRGGRRSSSSAGSAGSRSPRSSRWARPSPTGPGPCAGTRRWRPSPRSTARHPRRSPSHGFWPSTSGSCSSPARPRRPTSRRTWEPRRSSLTRTTWPRSSACRRPARRTLELRCFLERLRVHPGAARPRRRGRRGEPAASCGRQGRAGR